MDDLQKKILKFAEENQEYLKTRAIRELCWFMGSLSFEECKRKFEEGAKKHGPLDPKHDFKAEARAECMDHFLYTAIREYLKAADPRS